MTRAIYHTPKYQVLHHGSNDDVDKQTVIDTLFTMIRAAALMS